jgi:hypothetical protein
MNGSCAVPGVNRVLFQANGDIFRRVLKPMRTGFRAFRFQWCCSS